MSPNINMDSSFNSLVNQPTATIAAAVMGAIIAWLAVIYQTYKNGRIQKYLQDRSSLAQKELEDRKQELQKQFELFMSEIILTRSRLERSEQSSYRFQLERLEPFMEALNRAVLHSYSAVVGLSVLAGVRVHLAALVEHGMSGLSEWLKAIQDVSDLRIKVLLSIRSEHVIPFLTDLQEFVRLHNEILQLRSSFFSGTATYNDIARCHATYVRTGYKLIIDTKNAIETSGLSEEQHTLEQWAILSEKIIEPLERSSVVTVPYGSVHRNAWIAIWHIDREIVEYEEIHNGLEGFSSLLMDIAVAIHSIPTCIEAKMIRSGSDQDDKWMYALSCSFSDRTSRDDFCKKTLNNIKIQSKQLWKGYVAPVEIFIDMPLADNNT